MFEGKTKQKCCIQHISNTNNDLCSDLNPAHCTASTQHQDESYSGIKDKVISMEFRIQTLEQQINSKMQRSQCMTLMERKANSTQLKKAVQDITVRIENDRLREKAQFQSMQQDQMQKITDLKKKLTTSHLTAGNARKGKAASQASLLTGSDKILNQLDKVLVKPQQLFLESNETMFSMIVDEIKELKKQDLTIQRLIDSKHKKNVSLNNEVCRKLELLEREIEETIHYIDTNMSSGLKGNMSANGIGDSVINGKATKSGKKSASGPINYRSLQPQSDQPHSSKSPQSHSHQNQAFESIRLQLLSKTMQTVQKELSNKINIKDIVPLIKQNMTGLDDGLEEIRSHLQENFQSTRKILSNQAQINQEISNATRIAWWRCSVENMNSPLYIEKQLMNIVPEVFIWDQSGSTCERVKVGQTGHYLIKLHFGVGVGMGRINKGNIENNSSSQSSVLMLIDINGQKISLPSSGELVVTISAGSWVRFYPCSQGFDQGDQMFVQMQRL